MDIFQSEENEEKKDENQDDNKENQSNENSSGESILIPLEISEKKGKIFRSLGYTQPIQIVSFYKILDDGTLLISSNYNYILTEEIIWFISDNLRGRSSVTRSNDSLAILQTSYASEVRRLKL